MNTITHAGESFAFATVVELETTPLVRKFLDDLDVCDFAQGNGQLLACKLIERKPVWHLVGHLKDPVVLPKSMQGARRDDNRK